jgi:hypothetical protein
LEYLFLGLNLTSSHINIHHYTTAKPGKHSPIS